MIVFYLIVVGAIATAVVLVLIGMKDIKEYLSVNQLLLYVIPFIPVAVYIFFKVRENSVIKSYDPVPLDVPDTGHLNPITTAILAILSLYTLSVIIDPLTVYIPISDALKEVYKQMSNKDLWTAISIVIAAPLFEETVFRGMIERGLLCRMKPLYAILLSAFFFALIHMNFAQAVPAFIVGVLLGWVYYKTHSIWMAIGMHAFNNGVSFILSATFPQLGAEATTSDFLLILTGNPEVYPFFYAICCLVFVASIVIMAIGLPKAVEIKSFKLTSTK